MSSFKLISKKTNTFSILFLVIIGITSCTKDTDNLTFVPASIESISPDSGPGDTEVTISGLAFPTNVNNISVFFNDTAAVVNSVTSTEIKAVVPRGALTGIVKLRINGEETLGPEFNYIITPAQVSTLIRSEMPGDVDGPAAQASFAGLWGMLRDQEGSLFISDYLNNKIRKIDTNGIVSTVTGMTGVIGDVDGTLAEATFNSPINITMDSEGNIILVDIGTHKIRKINFSTGSVETIAGTGVSGLVNGDGTIAQFASPIGIAIDPSNNIYISEFNNAVIRKITPDNKVSTLTGNGVVGFEDGDPDIAQIGFTSGMEVDQNGNIVFADSGNHSIRSVTPQGVVSTIAGTGVAGDINGEATIAQFNNPLDVDIDSEGNIYVVDLGNQIIRKITVDGMVSTFAGTGEIGSTDGLPSLATFDTPRSLFIDENDIIYIATDDSIRIITPAF